MVGVSPLADSDCILARPQDVCSLCHPDTKHSGKTARCLSRRHRGHSTPPLQRLSCRTRRPLAGIWRCLLDAVCQLVGIGMVHWCNEREGGSARDATWRKAPCERAAAEASLWPIPDSARDCTVCLLQHWLHWGSSSNSITHMENTDERPASEKTWHCNYLGPKRVLCICFREGFQGKTEMSRSCQVKLLCWL
jgi:hypothetical protein